MPALLAAEVVAVAQHFINDLPVADAGAHDPPACRGDGRLQPRVAHDRADQGFLRQLSLREQVQPSDGHDVVSVDQFALLVAEQEAVGIAVVRNAQVGAVLPDFLAHELGVHRAAVFVDVLAVRLVAKDDDFRAQLAQHAGC